LTPSPVRANTLAASALAHRQSSHAQDFPGKPTHFMLQLRILPQDEYFLAHLTGLVSLEAWEQAIQELGLAVHGGQPARLVLDLTGLVGWLGVPERTQVGALMATHFASMKKVALFIQPEKIAGVVEAEARRNGLDLRLFPAFGDAVAWVLS
jgi:hypothetical protein